jgi:outer membrane protein OmpA-like peptidoglycan-associated protein
MPLRPMAALLLIAASACAPVRPAPGALAPVRARTTNEILAADLATIDTWEVRRVALLRNDGADLSTRTIVLARAGAWLAFARDAYVAHPRAQDADDALSEARRLIESLSGAATAASVPPAPSALLAAAEKLSPELWARLRTLEGRPDAATNVARLADAEIELVRAAGTRTIAPDRPLAPAAPFAVTLAGAPIESAPASAVVLPANVSQVSVSRLACPQVQHVARAGRLLGGDEPLVLLAGGMRLTVPDELRKKARTVHFALASDELKAPSASLLDGVAGAMREHPELSLVIEGHADPRGEDMSNLDLSGRRADAVRDLLVGNGVDGNRVLVRMLGATQRNASGNTLLDYARDRRVQLKFVLPDGSELPVNDEVVDLQIEQQRLWFGALRPGLRRFVAAPGSTVVARPRPLTPAKTKRKVKK